MSASPSAIPKLYSLIRLDDLAGDMRIMGHCIMCGRVDEIPLEAMIVTRNGRPRSAGDRTRDLEKKLRCHGCGNKIGNYFSFEKPAAV